MPIKWSAVAVSEAMDKVEQQVNLAEGFFAEAKAQAEKALSIANLPQYMEQRIHRLIWDIERMDQVKGDIKAVRNNIPDGAIEAEKGITKHGSQSSLM